MNGIWRAVIATAEGGSHTRKGLPNQDAVDKRQTSASLPVSIAVADGHGSEQYYRSREGSRLAVACVLDVLAQAESRWRNSPDDPDFPHWFSREAPQRLVDGWKTAVGRLAADCPLTEQESKMASRFPNASALEPYGSTCLGMLLCPLGLLAIQIGDGQSLRISPEGEVSRLFPDDPAFIANETSSLCMPNSIEYVQCAVLGPEALEQDMFLLTSDGLPNLFLEEKFPDLVNNIRRKLSTLGTVEEAESQLGEELAGITQKYDGDDISLGILKWFGSGPPARPIEPKVQAEKEVTPLKSDDPSPLADLEKDHLRSRLALVQRNMRTWQIATFAGFACFLGALAVSPLLRRAATSPPSTSPKVVPPVHAEQAASPQIVLLKNGVIGDKQVEYGAGQPLDLPGSRAPLTLNVPPGAWTLLVVYSADADDVLCTAWDSAAEITRSPLAAADSGMVLVHLSAHHGPTLKLYEEQPGGHVKLFQSVLLNPRASGL